MSNEYRQMDLEALVQRVAALNPDAGEIGPGMLRSLIEEAQRLVRPRSQPAFSGLCSEIGMDGKPVPPTDLRPRNCRERLRSESKPYPRSGCEACKATIVTGLSCPYFGGDSETKSDPSAGISSTSRSSKSS